MQIFNIETGNFKADGGAMFGVVPKMIWQKKYQADENNLCSIANRSLLIDTGKRVVLIDSGIGTKQDEKWLSFHHLHGNNSLEKSLKKHGYHWDDITDLILTHLHWDHCGGAVIANKENNYELQFPNAKIWISVAQWDWATDPNMREEPAFLQENILPLLDKGQIEFVNKDAEIIPGIEVRLFNGHTKGLMLPLINTGTKKIFFAGDLIRVMANLPLVYVAAYDIAPLDSIEEKDRILKEAAMDNWVLVFQHDAINEACTVRTTEKGVREKEILKIDSLTQR